AHPPGGGAGRGGRGRAVLTLSAAACDKNARLFYFDKKQGPLLATGAAYGGTGKALEMQMRALTLRARTALAGTAALALLFAAGPLAAKEPQAAGGSMATLAQLGIEIEGMDANDPLMSKEDFDAGTKIYFERCAGCHGV